MMHAPTRFMKTRIAPTPSGFLHEGNAYAFVLTAALAKKHDATLLLRIDDLDNDRKRDAYVDDVFQTLRWLGIDWQEGPQSPEELDSLWSQRHRLPVYEEALEQLCNTGLVYACGCSRKELADFGGVNSEAHLCRSGHVPLSAPDAAWRIRVPEARTVRFRDMNGNTVTLSPASLLPDPVVRRRDGVPAYQVASLCDDHHFGIDLIVRGEDLLPSTAVQLFLAELLCFTDFTDAAFIHHPLIRNSDGDKWSKSAGNDAESTLRSDGASSHALYARLGKLHGLGGIDDLEAFTSAWDGRFT